jgi:hypothetical protein
MTIKYAILNPASGSYQYSDTLDGAATIAAQNATAFYNEHTHGAFLTVVEEVDGAEKWYAPTGEQVPTNDDIVAKAARTLRSLEQFKDADTLTVTKLGV